MVRGSVSSVRCQLCEVVGGVSVRDGSRIGTWYVVRDVFQLGEVSPGDRERRNLNRPNDPNQTYHRTNGVHSLLVPRPTPWAGMSQHQHQPKPALAPQPGLGYTTVSSGLPTKSSPDLSLRYVHTYMVTHTHTQQIGPLSLPSSLCMVPMLIVEGMMFFARIVLTFEVGHHGGEEEGARAGRVSLTSYARARAPGGGRLGAARWMGWGSMS